MKRFYSNILGAAALAALLAPAGGAWAQSGAGAHDGIYSMTNADGSAGDYLSVHTSGGNMIATIYRSSGPLGESFSLTDGGKNVATLYRWGSWDLYSGAVSGNNATLTGYTQYGLCKAGASIAFSGAGGTIKVTPNGASEFAPAGAHPECSAAGVTLTMQQLASASASAAGEGVYQITNADGSAGDYVSVHASGASVMATVYRSADPATSAGFALADGGGKVATLYKWGSWDLYSGSQSGSNATLTGYAQYGLCNAKVSMTFSGDSGTIKVTPSGPSEFAPAGAHPECSAAGATLSMQRLFGGGSGGSGDGDGGGSGTFADCFNEADYHAGTVFDYTERHSFPGFGLPPTEIHIVRTTKARARFDFAGVSNLIPWEYVEPGLKHTHYYDIVNGNILTYGVVLDDGSDVLSILTSTPLITTQPVNMLLGQAYKQNYHSIGTNTDRSGKTLEIAVEMDVAMTQTYVARENISTPMGTFDACKLTTVSDKNMGGLALTETDTYWIAATGPYRGQPLKTEIVANGGTTLIEVISGAYTPK